MAGHNSYQRSMFECVDRNPESIPGSIANTNGALFYHVEVKCGARLVTCDLHTYKSGHNQGATAEADTTGEQQLRQAKLEYSL